MTAPSTPNISLMKYLRIAPLASAAVLAACTTVAYDGASRPDSEVATISSERTLVSTIDGKPVPYSGGNFAKFKVLPGPHVVGVTLNDTGLNRISKKPLEVRFNAEAGKAYITRAVYNDRQWHPEIVEAP